MTVYEAPSQRTSQQYIGVSTPLAGIILNLPPLLGARQPQWLRSVESSDPIVRRVSRGSVTNVSSSDSRCSTLGEIEPYYEHQNDTSKPPNHQINALGISLNLYF
jgi:hypothetical protein